MLDDNNPAPRGSGNRAGIGHADQRSDTAPTRPAQLAPDTATAAGWGDRPPPKRLRLIAWRTLVKGALRGFATVELPIGLRIADCPVLVSKGKAWASLPSKPVHDGRQKINANRKPAYVAVLEWNTRTLQDQFSTTVVELVRRAYPGALDEAGP
jgi:hypothetical protein